ncbi:MAG: hypothetical protein H7232_06210, partial [Aeromicrobium sp.]|nr:hypothetical protein [Burkholderiales bacterium]
MHRPRATRIVTFAPMITLAGITCSLIATLNPISLHAQTAVYPSKPITLIVPFTGGTTADSLARLLGAKLSERWGVATITDNRAGASGIIGTDAAAKALPNG